MTGEHRLMLALAAAACTLLFAGLGDLDLWAPDEPRYAAVAEELRAGRHGAAGLALLHLNGAPYRQKPPGYFWLAALAGAARGSVGELEARLPSALAGVAVVLWVARFGCRHLGAASGALAGALLLTTIEFAHRARRVQLDVVLTLLETAGLFAFYRAHCRGGPRRRDVALLHGALGLAVLVKGPVGVIVPVLVIAAFLVSDHRAAELRRWLPPWSLLLSLGPGLAWLAAVVALGPADTFDAVVVDNLFGRFFAGTSHDRPAAYYLTRFPASFLPWTLLWPLVGVVAVRHVFRPGADPERRRTWRFLLAWVAVSVVFFSLSSGKRALYLLPAFPAAALLCADAAAWRRARGAAREGLARLWVAVAAVAAVELCVFRFALPALDAEKSPRPVAEAASALVPAGEPVGLAQKATLLGGLLYYGHREVALLASPAEVAAFFRGGGRAVVTPEEHLPALARATPVVVRSRHREGRRALVVVTPAEAPP